MYYDKQNPNFFERFWRFFKTPTALSVLIIINAFVFLIIGGWELYNLLFALQNQLQNGLSLLVLNLSLPADLSLLGQRPWTVFTYMFVHEDFLHFFFNMVTLYFAGVIFRNLMSYKQLLISYILGGLAGAALFILAYNTFPVFDMIRPFSIAVGASASIMAVLFAAVAYAPSYSMNLLLIGRLKLVHIALVIVVMDVLFNAKTNPGGFIAHLGGAIAGLAIGALIRYRKFPKPHKLKVKKKKVQSNPTTKSRPETDDDFRKRKADDQKRIDSILDKISQGGYQSLSKEEKEFLFRHNN